MAIDPNKIKQIAERFILSEQAYANHEWILMIDSLLENKTLFIQKRELLEQLIQAQGSKDYLYLADLLLYELLPLLNKNLLS